VDPAQKKIMEYTERRVEDVVIVDLEGKATFGTRGAALCQIVGDLLDRGESCILLNMAEVSYIDSGGLGDLVVSFVRVSKRNGQLKLLNLNDKHRDVLEITRLIDVIQHFSDETEAVNSFESDRRVRDRAGPTKALKTKEPTRGVEPLRTRRPPPPASTSSSTGSRS